MSGSRVWPDGDGFVILDVWRTEADARAFLESVVHPVMAKIGSMVGLLVLAKPKPTKTASSRGKTALYAT
ncbi:hypothetical protein OG394_16140 [Kribbella sp. NBC_01245]|uniref:hypothetical protein n=1 Tax=Kribbella sp. NBC_01245 TaxID=2903578 RepID=UPI002E27FEA7|nr:hypothetical protein [Kribbella sp. NBC_01245]